MAERSGPEPWFGIALLSVAVVLFGVAYGADSVASGNGVLRPVVASLVILGGAAQIAAEGVVDAGGGNLPAVLVGAALNLRFVGFGIAIAPALTVVGLRRLLAIHLIGDHSVGVPLQEPSETRQRRFFAIGILMWVAWVAGTAIGVVAGSALDADLLGADGAIAGGFIALTLSQITDVRTVVVTLIAFGSTLVIMALSDAGLAVVGGGAAGVTVERFWRVFERRHGR